MPGNAAMLPSTQSVLLPGWFWFGGVGQPLAFADQIIETCDKLGRDIDCRTGNHHLPSVHDHSRRALLHDLGQQRRRLIEKFGPIRLRPCCEIKRDFLPLATDRLRPRVECLGFLAKL